MKTSFFSALLLVLTGFVLSGYFPLFGRKSGIDGYLYKISGNQMPSPDIKRASPQGIKGKIYIYELTRLNQVTRQEEHSSLYTSVSTRLVKEVETMNNGYFKVKLPPGKYSVFLKADTVLYSNRFDSENNINPVEVLPKKMTRVELMLDHNAVY